ncbi:membrane-binding protein [Fulvivirga sp. M361]|uniref:toxin-antitoxin system YwqK family antitoxin n=1 Tax=Fulvivirga sp. M361 TaxID=2594266 RepID=UPI00117A66DE|nr:toxin-antitoxin system YwqK family antitoxin [Fulvivirga sp. M361]TRX51311.1 membrane-binding protein [Fulvivirga sp. M361]
MKALTYIALSLVTMVSYGQIERFTYHDEDKKKVKEVYHVTDTFSNVLEGGYLSYYLNGQLESKGRFSNNETVGSWEFYYETGNLKMVGNLKPGSNDGYWEYYFESGIKSMEGEISRQKRRGEWLIYYESGELKEQGNFRGNKREGIWTLYYEDGQKKGVTDYTYGKGRAVEYYATREKRAEGPKSGVYHVGLWRYYFKNGQLQAEGLYQNGKKTGDWKYYYKNGQLAATGTFDNDEAQGKWSYYHENGEVSSSGEFIDGKKSGYWGLFNDDGTLRGETNFDQGSGIYTEYYLSGKVRMKGKIQNEKKQKLWKYYYETGQLEGECNFEDGKGEYHGYYPDGTLQTKGMLENDEKVGRWELYKNDGELSGYYMPIYDQPDISNVKNSRARSSQKYGVGEYRFKSRKFKYFDAKINEFQGVIMQFNPFLSFLGRAPFGVEFYLQERLGHEFEFEGIRDPFYTMDDDVALNDVFTRGYNMALKQKFYNPDNKYGLWYFGHEIRFSNLSHFANIINEPAAASIIRASASEQKIEYSVILGYRLMQNTRSKGFTVDGFVSLGTGYRNFDVESNFNKVFDELNQNQVPLTFNFGLSLGYAFSFGARRR